MKTDCWDVNRMSEDTWYRKGPAIDQLSPGCEPQAGVPIGVPEGETLGIYVNDEAAGFISKYIMADTERPMGGILVGHAAKETRPFILISGAIEARDAEIVDGYMTFTDHSWEYMRQVWGREYPNTLVLGWFCSHPDKGLAVSGYERFLHHRAFNRPWQVLFIVDPIANTSLFYRWSEDRVMSVPNFTVWNARKEPPASLISSRTVNSNTVDKRPNKHLPREPVMSELVAAAAEAEPEPRRLPYVWIWVILAMLLFLFFWPTMPWSITRIWSVANERHSELQLLQEQIPVDTEDEEQQPEPISLQPTDDGLNGSVSGAVSRASPQVSTPSSNTYEVKSGDTLWSISERTTGNPLVYQRLAEANGIANPSLIHPGYKLQLDVVASE